MSIEEEEPEIIQNEKENENSVQQKAGFDPHYAPPTDDEIRQLRNTSEIVHSQLLKMEVYKKKYYIYSLKNYCQKLE